MKSCLFRLTLLAGLVCAGIIAIGFVVSSLVHLEPRQVVQYAMERAIDRIDKPVSDSSSAVAFRIEKGESSTQIAERLQKAGLIQNINLFKILTMYFGVSSSLEAGEYELNPGMTSSEIISCLHRGLVKTMTITIPEGWRAEQTASELEKKGVFSSNQYMESVKTGSYDYGFLKGKPAGTTLEGYLFPDTYNIQPQMTAKEFVDLQLHTFDTRVTPILKDQAAPQGLTVHQIVTLASIVERETAVGSERPLIAGVYLNRLKNGMLLQADPTVQYALAVDAASIQRNGFWKKGLLLSDLKVESLYNTYKYKGLPPGPIASPGLDSIKAVLSPVTTDYLYFVAKPDGSHAFARTNEEHNANVRKYGN